MPDQPSVSTENVPPGRAARAGSWTVVNRDGEFLAVSSRCRHQLADLSKGAVGADGCLVCPWHGSRYNLDTGEMVAGPQGFATYQGPTPGYSGFVRWTLGRFVKLRRRATRVDGNRVVVEA
jgi:nitrite reductase/ring-hydroxylating ferredoxin subunit